MPSPDPRGPHAARTGVDAALGTQRQIGRVVLSLGLDLGLGEIAPGARLGENAPLELLRVGGGPGGTW